LADFVLDLVESCLDDLQPAFYADDAERHEQEGESVEQCRNKEHDRHPPGQPNREREREFLGKHIPSLGGGEPSSLATARFPPHSLLACAIVS
jgi:hypothetical protein